MVEVFKINTDGTGYTILHNFSPINYNGAIGVFTNADGANPFAGLITNSAGNALYGTANGGGSSGYGTVFAVNTDGTGFTNLHSFTYSDGAAPWAGLIVSGTTLYGTAMQGGRSGNGTVFKINTDGTGFTILHGFTATALRWTSSYYTNSDGASPFGGLALSGNTQQERRNQEAVWALARCSVFHCRGRS
jgi:uncharacterized repeat protein (TIGR03803 family)